MILPRLSLSPHFNTYLNFRDREKLWHTDMESTEKNRQSLEREIERRRTFAIIAHPDAGKTTLTEKLLLYGGAIHLAGHVRARKDRRSTRSDWMALEKDRGISISSAALQFEYQGFLVNLLDTPGHQDFSEDTYRTLIAADAADKMEMLLVERIVLVDENIFDEGLLFVFQLFGRDQKGA